VNQTKLLILVDYKNHFYSSTIKNKYSLDLQILINKFRELNFCTEVKKFNEIDFRQKPDYKYAIYQSSEDRNLHYKEYIEDILLGLKLLNVTLIPRFELFRAHHNKVFMEILRHISRNECVNSIVSNHYGTYEDLINVNKPIEVPFVIKTSAGTGSKSIELAYNNSELLSKAKTISKTYQITDYIKEKIKSFLRPAYIPSSMHRRKFIVQKFIPELAFDFKVLVYYDKYYVLKRYNRKNDFRASGSGLFEWPFEPSYRLLDFARSIFEYFNVPIISLDIAFDGSNYFLIEFQFLMFGPYTIEKSRYYFKKINNNWERIEGHSSLENEFVDSISKYIKLNLF